MVSRTECNEVNASLLLNLINNNFLILLTENFPILNPYLPQKSENLRPILVTLLKMRPHYSQSSRENVTPSSGTSPLASCKGVPPPPGGRGEWVGYSEIEELKYKKGLENLSNGPLVKFFLKRGAYLFIQRNSRIASRLPALEIYSN